MKLPVVTELERQKYRIPLKSEKKKDTTRHFKISHKTTTQFHHINLTMYIRLVSQTSKLLEEMQGMSPVLGPATSVDDRIENHQLWAIGKLTCLRQATSTYTTSHTKVKSCQKTPIEIKKQHIKSLVAMSCHSDFFEILESPTHYTTQGTVQRLVQ